MYTNNATKASSLTLSSYARSDQHVKAIRSNAAALNSVRITGRGSVRITCAGSARDSVRITARDSVRITARDSVRITARDSVRITGRRDDFALAA
jgi:uncharacterized protein (DUF2345 family)